jgi:NitT/TauT family transport system ATP-binding protein
LTPEATTSGPSRSVKLQMRDVSLVFERDGKNTPVLDQVNLEIAAGEFVCLVGPSGCGKSTLLNVMAGFLSPTKGVVAIDGQAVRGPNPRRILVFQDHGVFPWLTVEGNIEFGLSGLSGAERKARIAHYVQMVRLKGFEHAYPLDLSGGMKQRLQVARALAMNPDVLFMDEPFGALDAITRVMMRAELLQIWQAERRTVIFVTHDVDEAVQLADRVVVLSSRPAKIQSIHAVDIQHPRNISSPRYLEHRDDLLRKIGLAYSA